MPNESKPSVVTLRRANHPRTLPQFYFCALVQRSRNIKRSPRDHDVASAREDLLTGFFQPDHFERKFAPFGHKGYGNIKGTQSQEVR
jgi:hypothetical protein